MMKLFNDKAFYKNLFVIVLPIIIQNAVTSFVNLIDNIMVGQIGTEAMSAVSVCNQLNNVYMFLIFGAFSAVGIFACQFKGKEDNEGILNCFRLKNYLAVFMFSLVLVAVLVFGRPILRLFFNNPNNTAELSERMIELSLTYFRYMLPGLLFFTFSICINTTLRELGNTFTAMMATVVAIIVNVSLNYVLIFGHFGFPALGVSGAAVATSIARAAEVAILVLFIFRNSEFCYLTTVFSKFSVPLNLCKDIALKGGPLLMNEVFYSFGEAGLSQCYSKMGVDALAAMNINLTVANFFSVACFAMGTATSIVLGQLLGKGELNKAKPTAMKLLYTNIFISVIFGACLFVLAPYFPRIYNTSIDNQLLATDLLRIYAVHLPLLGIYHTSYFIIRSGGKTMITFWFDGFYTCFILFGTALLVTTFTSLDIFWLYVVVNAVDLIKTVAGFVLVKSGFWIQNIVSDL